MLIDDVKIEVTAGRGGSGRVTFNKNKMELGPTGGDGGRGGSVYAVGVSDIGALKNFRYKKTIIAEDGKDGLPRFQSGSNGKDVFLRVPVGTVIHNLYKGTKEEITKIGEEVLLARGGKGGRGNFHFRSSTNTSPKEFEEGKPGDYFLIRLELKLIADVGFVGLPNVGKSSLLNELTRTKRKVANYPFTTLEPGLGVYYELIIADIPGLIAGASQGKGLGIKFLRHIERTKVLFHFLAADSTSFKEDYETVREELRKHSEKLSLKEEYVIISKKDEVAKEKVSQIKKEIKKINPRVTELSILDEESIKEVRKILDYLIAEKKSL